MKKGLSFFLVLAVLITAVLTQTTLENTWLGNTSTKEVTLDEFLQEYQRGSFDTVKVIDSTKLEWHTSITLTGQSNQSNLMTTRTQAQNTQTVISKTNKPQDTSLSELWILVQGTNNATTIEVVHNEKSIRYVLLFESIIPLIIMVVAFIFLLRFLAPKGWAGMPFVWNAGKLTDKKAIATRFNDVIGMEEVKQELTEIVDYLKNPQKYQKVWARVPKGVLLHGAPGSGKTLLARAVAGEAHVPFFSASWPEFIEMFVGAGTLKIRDLFKRAKASGKAIIFIDEIDSIGGKRGRGPSGAHREQENMLNQILTEMDGFEKDASVIVIAATNRPDILDPALLRSGRFDRKVRVGKPTTSEREMIIDYYLKNKKAANDVDRHSLALRTSWLVGADIENIVNEASLKIAKENREILTREDFEYALEKVVMGPEKKIKTMKEQEREIITYHELWHAICAHMLPKTDPVEKISIVSRGMALWVTRTIPEEEKYLYSRAKFNDDMVMLLGGRAAEEIFFGKDEITTGAANDFQRATRMATDMVLKYGMDEDLGPVMYHDDNQSDVFYGQTRRYSNKTAELADKKIKKLLDTAYTNALKLIKKHKKLMGKMGEILLEKEYLSKEEFNAIMNDHAYADVLLKRTQDLKGDMSTKKSITKKKIGSKKTTKPTKKSNKTTTKTKSTTTKRPKKKTN